MKILVFGRYDPEYSRNRVILKGLRTNGVEVLECQVPPSSRFWFFILPLKYLYFIIHHSSFEVVLVPFPGQEVVPLARWLTKKPIIFDAFTSHYEGYVLDRKSVAPDSRKARRLRDADVRASELADVCLTDTATHADWWASEFSLPRSKFFSVFVGTDTSIFRPMTPASSRAGFLVHFHGSYIPLQGVDIVVQAAALLKDKDITFHMYGRGQTYAHVRALAEKLRTDQVKFKEPVTYEELALRMAQADVCLGIFGTSPKTQRVIPNKVFEALGLAKPVITADTAAVRELLDEDSALLVPMGDAPALANAILRLKDNPDKRASLGERGREILEEQAMEGIVGKRILLIIDEARLLQA